MSDVTGRTRVYAIVADPVRHVRTPQVLNARFAARGHDAILVPLHVAAADLATAFAAFRVMRNLGGVVVTVPHKGSAAALCDALGPSAAAVAAVNVVRREDDGRLTGENFDGEGFVEGLRREGLEPRGMTVLLSGAGGAASAIAFGLARAGAARLTIANRTQEKARALAARLRSSFPALDVRAGEADPTGHQLVVNATSLGMHPADPLPLDAEALTPGMVAAEVVMAPERTAFLREATRRGCRVHLGRYMLEAQSCLLATFLERP